MNWKRDKFHINFIKKIYKIYIVTIIIIVWFLTREVQPKHGLISPGERASTFSVTIENVELIQECSPEHSSMI